MLNLIFSNKIFGVLFAVLVAIVGTYIINKTDETNKLKFEIERLNVELALSKANSEIVKSNLNECNIHISSQNELINRLRLTKPPDTKQIEKEIRKKMSKIKTPKDNECENRLKFYELNFKELGR